MKKIILGIIIGVIISGTVGVIAATTISSKNVTYQNKTVNNALDELYNNAATGKELIAAAITNKGITTTSMDTYETMATNINNLSIQSIEHNYIYDNGRIDSSITLEQTSTVYQNFILTNNAAAKFTGLFNFTDKTSLIIEIWVRDAHTDYKKIIDLSKNVNTYTTLMFKSSKNNYGNLIITVVGLLKNSTTEETLGYFDLGYGKGSTAIWNKIYFD